MSDSYDLSRFTTAHQRDYETALHEIRQGRKKSHWIWYIFPQVRGLGKSSTSQYYAIQSLEEARAFLNDPVLGGHLTEISAALLTLPTNNASDIFGWPDNLKLRSCMTLFSLVSAPDSVFHQVLDKFFGGQHDGRTLQILHIRS